MSAAPKIIEGTWEEIVSHSRELSGHHLKVIVLDTPMTPTSTQTTLSPEEWVARLRQWSLNRPPNTHFVDDSRDTIYEDYLK
jgi:hypothetical protein